MGHDTGPKWSTEEGTGNGPGWRPEFQLRAVLAAGHGTGDLILLSSAFIGYQMGIMLFSGLKDSVW